MTMMNRICEDARTDILNFLLDVKNQQDTKLGPIYVQIPGRLGGNLRYQEFWARLRH
jgi:hypothetical protein